LIVTKQMSMLRRTFVNQLLLASYRIAGCRAYSTAGYGNATTSNPNLEGPPLDIEDPHDILAQKHTETGAPEARLSEEHPVREKKEKTEREREIKQQRKNFNSGDQESVRKYSEGCD